MLLHLLHRFTQNASGEVNAPSTFEGLARQLCNLGILTSSEVAPLLRLGAGCGDKHQAGKGIAGQGMDGRGETDHGGLPGVSPTIARPRAVPLASVALQPITPASDATFPGNRCTARVRRGAAGPLSVAPRVP